MEIIIEGFLQILLEGVLTVAPEIGFECVAHVFKRPPNKNPIAAVLGYGLIGLFFGGLSLLVFPRSFTQSQTLRTINLVFAPILGGIIMSSFKSLRERQGKEPLRLDSFSCGFCFALGIALIRFAYAQH
jgi:hypothetical protein